MPLNTAPNLLVRVNVTSLKPLPLQPPNAYNQAHELPTLSKGKAPARGERKRG